MKTIISILCGLLTFSVAQAESITKSGGVTVSGKTLDNVIVSGGARLNDVQANRISVSGGARLTRVKVNSVDVSGGLRFNNLEADTIDVSGSAQGNDLKCRNLDVSGGIKAQNIECNTLEVSGGAKLENVLASDGTLSGSVDIKKSQFNNLNLATSAMYLEDVIVNNIIVEEGQDVVQDIRFNKRGNMRISSSPQKQGQVLYLKGSTTVSGDVTFRSGKGTVVLEGGAQINGKVVGGEIQGS